jgi:aminopeptidase YwaD
MLKRILWLVPLALVANLCAADISSQNYLDDVKFLASPELRGRATGTPELEKAADFIAAKFRSFGLKPADGKNFEQAFPVTLGAHDGPGTHLRYKWPERSVVVNSSQFTPIGFSSSGKFQGQVVFAGYGITDKEKNYDDYEGIDVKDKFVLILRHEPNEDKAGAHGPSSHAAFSEKAVNAKMHGAKGVIIVNDVYAHDSPSDDLIFVSLAGGPTDAGIAFVQVKNDLAADWILKEGQDLRDLTKAIATDKKPHSFAMAKLYIDLDVDVRKDVKTVHNVTGYLAGTTDEYVVIGAHYDHLGMGDEHSLAPSKIGTIHPGADDNASGTAGVIELARYFSKQPKQRRGILFLTFAGEELGLFGSEYYVNHPILPIDKAVAMLNMDMIGRIREGKVFVAGTGTGSTFPELLREVKPPVEIHADITEKTGYGDSDHTSFTTKGVPVLFFFSGLHADYHKPSDTADKIDAPDAAKLLDYVAALTSRLASDAERPKYIRVAEPPQPPSSGASGSGYGPAFGSIPDFNEPPKGVRFADVRDGTPAAVAGLKAGDILIEFDGKEIGNLYDFTYALRAHKAGDSVLVKVIRGSQTIEAKVLLTERR